MKIRTHDYARRAYPLVDAMKGSDVEVGYRTQALNLPTMIMQSGLAQAIGFLMAKGQNKESKTEFTYLLAHMDTLLQLEGSDKQAEDEQLEDKQKDEQEDEQEQATLHDRVLQSNITEYQLLTRKALDASGWLKRYTEALLKKQTNDNPDTQDEWQHNTPQQDIPDIADNTEQPAEHEQHT